MAKKFVYVNGKPTFVDEEQFNTQQPTRQQKVSNGIPRKDNNAADMERRIKRADVGSGGGWSGALDDILTTGVQGITFGLNKRAYAAMNAIADKASQGGDFSSHYSKNLQAEEEASKRRSERSGLAGHIAEFGGGMLTPMGGAEAVNAAVTAARSGKALKPLAAHILGGAVTGGVAGGIEGAARSRDLTDIPNVARQAAHNAVIGATGGALLGPVAGAIGTGIGKVAGKAGDVLERIGSKSATGATARQLRRARYEKALTEGNILGEMGTKGNTIPKIEQRVTDLEAQGAEPRLADVSEFGQSRLKALIDRGTAGVEAARDVLTGRAGRRAGRMRQAIGDAAGVDPFYMAKLDQASHTAARKAQGAADYKIGGIMEGAVKLPPAAQKIIDSDVIPNDATEATFKDVYRTALKHLSANPDLDGKLMKGNKPTRRVINQMLKEFRTRADMAYLAGNGTLGSAFETQMNAFKGQVMAHNPRMRQMIQRQAKEFAWERASQEGEKLATAVDKEPEIVLSRLRQLKADPAKADEYEAMRAAILGKKLAHIGADRRSTYMENLRQRLNDTSQPNHMALWDELLGGKGQEIATKLGRESRAVKTDQRLVGSNTSANMAGLEDLDLSGLAGNLGRLGVGLGTGQMAMAGSGAIGLAKPALTAKLADSISGEQRRQLLTVMQRLRPEQVINGKIVPSTLSSMQSRASAAIAKRAARRALKAGAGGGAAAYIGSKATQQDSE